jgi:peroxiredoxin
MALATGSKAPEFTLKTIGSEGLADFSLSSNFGKKNTVLLFFPLAFTGVCTQELCDVTAGLAKYDSLNASVVGISVDSPFAQEAWAKKENINIPLVSDLNKETAKAYGVLLPDLIGLGARIAVKTIRGKIQKSPCHGGRVVMTLHPFSAKQAEHF